MSIPEVLQKTQGDRKAVIWGYRPVGVHAFCGRTRLKAALKCYFMKFELLQFSALVTGLLVAVGHRVGRGLGADFVFPPIKIKSHQLLSSASFVKHAASLRVLTSFLGRP